MISAKKQAFIALCYFLLASSLGIFLRLFPISDVSATYKFIVHTHSHIALLGWIYVGFTTLIYSLFIKKTKQIKFKLVFWATQITILGMLFSFPITGYALFSIIFSTLFLICSYWFYFLFKKYYNLKKENYVYKFINTSLLFMVISSIGPLALGIIMNTLGNTSPLYKNAIYFYLHFQYNGWFIFCLLGVFFYFLEKNKIHIHKEFISPFYKYMIISCFLTLFLSFLWMKPSKLLYLLSSIGAVYQIIALGKFQLILSNYKITDNKIFSPFIVKVLKLVYLLFVIKIVLQFLTSIPYFAELAFKFKDFVIGYLHLVFLGIASLSVLIFLHQQKLLKLNKPSVLTFLFGFILSESLIFCKGFCIWQQLPYINNYHLILVIVSSLMPIGILGIFISNLRTISPTRLKSH